MTVPVILAGELPGSGGGIACAAAAAVALASAGDEDGAAVVVEVGTRTKRGPTMLASPAARDLERELRGVGLDAAARGRLAWVTVERDSGESHAWLERVRVCVEASAASRAVVIFAPVELWRAALGEPLFGLRGALLRAELPEQRALAALAVGELRSAGLCVRIATRAPGRVASRRALAGIDPGGESGRRAARIATGLRRRAAADRPGVLAGESGQALPLVIGAALLLIAATLALAAFGGALTGKSRAQRAADLAALSAARSMRDDFDRLFVAARRPNGAPNPAHLSKAEYLARAEAAAVESAVRNDLAPGRLEVTFPDAESFAPLRVRAELAARIDLGEAEASAPVHAKAEAVPPSTGSGTQSNPVVASGGGYSGPLVYRQGKPMRPDVASAFDKLEAAARGDGVALIVTSAFRSDAEQAVLWAANPDPRWVAPPGTSLHRCATELDLGPASAYAWLAAHAPRFAFTKRYSWEPWHFGYDGGPAPCSAAGDRVGSGPAAGAATGPPPRAGSPTSSRRGTAT